MKNAGIGLIGAAAVAVLAAATPVSAQGLSEKSVRTFMEYAWSMVPSQFTPPSGKTIIIDKKNHKDDTLVPVKTAREVIMAARMSAHAQVCELIEEQVMNYRSMMKRESDKKQWSPQQMVYINQLHLTTVMLLTGKIKLIEKDGDKEIVVEEKAAKAQTCTDEQKKKVKDVIAKYVAAGPSLAAVPGPATTGTTKK